MNRRLIVIVLLIGMVLGCDSVKKFRDPMLAFDDATRAYRQAVSWAEFVVAATFLKNEDEEKKEEQIEHLDQFKVTAYEPRAITVIEEDVRIRQVVKISYFKRDNLVVKTIADDQLWEYDSEMHTWHILSGLPKFK